MHEPWNDARIMGMLRQLARRLIAKWGGRFGLEPEELVNVALVYLARPAVCRASRQLMGWIMTEYVTEYVHYCHRKFFRSGRAPGRISFADAQQLEPYCLADADGGIAALEDAEQQTADIARVQGLLSTLPRPQAAVVCERMQAGRARDGPLWDKIGARLGMTTPAARAHYTKALRRLRENWNRGGAHATQGKNQKGI